MFLCSQYVCFSHQTVRKFSLFVSVRSIVAHMYNWISIHIHISGRNTLANKCFWWSCPRTDSYSYFKFRLCWKWILQWNYTFVRIQIWNNCTAFHDRSKTFAAQCNLLLQFKIVFWSWILDRFSEYAIYDMHFCGNSLIFQVQPLLCVCVSFFYSSANNWSWTYLKSAGTQLDIWNNCMHCWCHYCTVLCMLH